MPYTNQRICISGQYLELNTYEKPIRYGKTSSGTRVSKKIKQKRVENFDSSAMSAMWRAKAKLRRLSKSNVGQWINIHTGKPCLPIFITLTFAENVTDSKSAFNKFKKGIMRFNDHWKEQVPEGLKYIAVPELQKEREVYHFHILIFNLPFIPKIYDAVLKIWGHGFTNVKPVRNSDHVTNYLMKYFSKEFGSKRELNENYYSCSNGLRQSTVFLEPYIINYILKRIPENCKPKIEKTVDNDWLGKIERVSYQIPRGVDILGMFKDAKLATPTSQGKPDRPLPLNN